jgi:hypothetical protein
MPHEWIAERALFAENQEKGRLSVIVRIGRPSLDPDMQRWGCPTWLDGLEPKPVTIRGLDSWQALELAMAFAMKTMVSYEDRGTVFYWQTGQRMEARHLFSGA